MLDVLCPLITESDNVSTQLLDIILINIVEPNKSARKNAYQLAKDLIVKTSETIEQYITQVEHIPCEDTFTNYKTKYSLQLFIVVFQSSSCYG